MHRLISSLLCFTFFTSSAVLADKIIVDSSLPITSDGRLMVFFSKSDETEPRFYSESAYRKDEVVLGMDLDDWNGKKHTFQAQAGYPFSSLDTLPDGRWFAQALYDSNTLAADINAEHNLYSDVVAFEKGKNNTLRLTLSHAVPAESLPEDSEYVRYFKFRSALLSQFWGTDVYLRAAALLPPGFNEETASQYPVLFQVGGFRSRYTRVQQYTESAGFDAIWSKSRTVIIFLDGEAPYGDSYQIDSANNGPYGDATWLEFMPWLYQQLGLNMSAKQRYITGCSTGGWVSLAMQLYYPRLFNGTWSFSPDGVDFRAFQLVDLYSDDNAFVNEYGLDRPSSRDKDGELRFTIRQEVAMEKALGRGNSFTTGSGQWGGWNAVYSPKDGLGKPQPVWDDVTGDIDQATVAYWERYDLNKVLASRWAKDGKDLQGKIHIWMGDMDEYYLNNALHPFEATLNSLTNPKPNADIRWHRNTGHCDFDRAAMLGQVLTEIQTQ